ncbi:MAG: TQO small subunit DoxD, partial [Ktedonobacterales bacterium]
MKTRARAGMTPAWVLAPLRLFFGITFIYAGVQKLTDPQFFKKSAPGYIGKQILAFAHGTPLHGFLLHIAEPHAVAFGVIVALGEMAIGLGTLTGILFRLAAVFGALLSLVFFLSASWRVYPYFYGADIVFVFGWITLILAQPAACGWP